MIISRIAGALRRQDWTQVTVEIFIVVIGIFLGLQVQAWYEDSQAMEEEARTIGYFIADLEKNKEVLLERNLFMDNQIALGYFVLNKLESKTLSDDEKLDFDRGVTIAGFSEPVNSFLSSINAENLAKVRNNQVRRTLDGFVGVIDRLAVVTRNIKTNMEASLPYINSKSSFIFGGSSEGVAEYDFEELANDPKYKKLFVNVLGKTIAYQSRLTIMIEESNKMIEVLKAYQAGAPLPEVEFQ